MTDDQHGTMGGHGTADLTPPAFVTTQVCGQAGSGGVGGFPCEGAFSSIWDSEIIGVENWATRSSPGNLVGADCNYGSGAAPCVYRFNHTFCSDNNWLFTGQNCMGIMSPDWKLDRVPKRLEYDAWVHRLDHNELLVVMGSGGSECEWDSGDLDERRGESA